MAVGVHVSICVCMYDEKARGREREFHSISRPLTIERVRSAVCTQDISSERSSVAGPVECTEKTLHTVPCTPVVARRIPFPCRASFFPRFLPSDPPRRKGFSISFSPPLLFRSVRSRAHFRVRFSSLSPCALVKNSPPPRSFI